MSASTPGPWTVEFYVKAGGVTHLAVTARHAGSNWMPCSVSPMEDVRDVDRANANLISAAPDLRDALQEFLEYSEGGCNPNLEDVYRAKARAALAKAKGQP